jgi:MscS family membrane protein
MLDFLPETITIREITIALLGLVVGTFIFVIFRLTFVWLKLLLKQLTIFQTKDIYQKLIKPNEIFITSATVILLVELISVLLPKNSWTNSLEIVISLSLAITTSLLASRLFKNFFDFYLLNAAFKTGRKLAVNS